MSDQWDTVDYSYTDERIYEEVTLGQLMDACIDNPMLNVVFVGTSRKTVGELHSWRGSYDIPAISYEDGEKTGAQVYTELKEALKHKHYGYKGGEYNYREHEKPYVSRRGSCEEFMIVKIDVVGSDLVLYTKIVPY